MIDMCSTKRLFFLEFGGEYNEHKIIFLMSPVASIGRNKAHATSSGFGIKIFSFENVKRSEQNAMPAPPPHLAPGLGVEMYNCDNCLWSITKDDRNYALTTRH